MPSGEIDYSRATLPKFKDKVMYTSASGREESYTVSSSYKGILRLSPNDTTTIYEEIDSLLIPDFSSIETNYTDAIVFEGEASLENLASIERRMLVVSDSDSYAVDLRISKTGVEFKNLNVVGISKFNHVTIYAGDKDKNPAPIKIGNTILPYCHNEGDKTRTDGTSYDKRDVNVLEEGDNSYFLYSDGSGEERSFIFRKAKPFIENLVLDALLDLQTIPTGSIHFVPVNITQYKALLGISETGTNGKASHKPNIYSDSTDPIVRDFLLCDGRRYNTKDFPELAKILWNENVEYWRRDKKEDDYFLQRSEYKNNFSTDDTNKTFRVPDLRRMFISTLGANGVDGYSENGAELKSGTFANNYPGRWMSDNLPKGINGTDRHFHFMAYGTYTPIVSFNHSNNNVKYDGKKSGDDKSTPFIAVARDDGNGLMELGEHPAVLTLTNHFVYGESGVGCGFGVGEGGLRRRDYWGYEPWPCIAYMAGPRTADRNIKNYEYAEPSIGRTSGSIPLISYVGNTNATKYNSDENNTLNGEKYVSLDENLFGYENNPKFYACLPLIKI